MDVSDLIRFENENTTLDFKAIQYDKERFESLIKDIMAMANSNILGDKYIIVGVKHRSSGERDLVGIERSELVDSAVYQQLILENIEPNIIFDYFPYEFESKVFGIFKISNCLDRPYMMKKDFKNLKKGDCLIRKGSQQSRAERRDFDRIYESKTNNVDHDKFVHLSFEGFSGMEEIELPAVRRNSLPSERAREKIVEILERKRNEPEIKGYLNIMRSMGSFTSPFGVTPYEARSIEELEKNLANVRETYIDYDYYEIYELRSRKLNIKILNNGQSYLEDCSIKVVVKKIQGFLLASRTYPKPEHDITRLLKGNLAGVETIMYPTVESTEDAWVISQQIGDLRHQIPIKAFNIEIRVVPTERIVGQIIDFECSLYGKNISSPIQRTLRIKVVEPN